MSKVVLVVDDSVTIRQELALVLAPEGFQVVEAADGIDALARVRAGGVSLVLCDVNMPRMNGFEFLRELRMDAELHATVVFVLTTSDSKSERAKAYQENIAGYMVKSGVGHQVSGLARFLTEYRATVLLP